MLSFAPDAIDIAPESLSAVSAVPTMRGYATPPAGVDMGVAQLSESPQGAAYLLLPDGTTRTLVGTAGYIFEMSTTTWTDRSRTAGPPAYTAGSNRWAFAQFGATSLAINKATVLQSGTTGAFADVANSPKAALMETAAGFVMLANTNDTGLGITGLSNGDQPHRWHCSQYGAPTSTWAPDPATQCTTGLLVETPGAITALKRMGNDIVAYKARSIYVGQYVGPPEVWRWRCVTTDVGCSSSSAVVSVGGVHYFVGDSDIYAFNGATATPIGALVKDWFLARLYRPGISGIKALHNLSSKRITWFYPTVDSTLDAALVYHYDTQRWGHYSQTVQDVVETVTGQITYGTLGDLYATYGDLPEIAYGSPFWSASTPVLAYISSDDYIKSLSGTASQMTMTTGWSGSEDAVSLCTRMRPRFRTSPSSAVVVPESVMSLGDAVTVGSSSTMHDGRCDVLQSAKYHRGRWTFSGQCEVEAVVPTLQPDSEE